MNSAMSRLKAMNDGFRIKCAADGRKPSLAPPDVLPPSEWEKVRLEMQSRLRAFTGEPDAIINFEFPSHASL